MAVRSILHLDADVFFAAAADPKLRGNRLRLAVKSVASSPLLPNKTYGLATAALRFHSENC